jgi:hypothetical protein
MPLESLGDDAAGANTAAAMPPIHDHPEYQALQQRVAAFEAQATQAKADGIRAQAQAFADGAARDSKILPAGIDALANLVSAINLSAAGLPVQSAAGQPIDVAASLKGFVDGLPAHNLTGAASTALPPSTVVLPNGSASDDAPTAEQFAADLGASHEGRALLAKFGGDVNKLRAARGLAPLG